MDFHCLVRSDSRLQLNGKVVASTDATGVALFQNGALVAVSRVGADARWKHGATIVLPVENGTLELELRPDKGVSGSKLAQDVVCYLRGEGPEPSRRAFSVPPAMRLFLALPIGIYFLGKYMGPVGSGSWARVITVGVWAGLAGLTIGACQMILKRAWGHGARVLACTLTMMVGYGIVLGYIGHTRGLFNHLSMGATAADWHTYKIAAARCEVLLPSSPQAKHMKLQTQAGPIAFDIFTARDSVARREYCLGFNDYPPAVLAPAKVMLDGAQRGAANAIKGKIVNSASVNVEGFPGCEFTVRTPASGIVVSRLFLVGNRLYQLSVNGPDVQLSSPDVQRFFASFQFRPAHQATTRGDRTLQAQAPATGAAQPPSNAGSKSIR